MQPLYNLLDYIWSNFTLNHEDIAISVWITKIITRYAICVNAYSILVFFLFYMNYTVNKHVTLFTEWVYNFFDSLK